MIKYLVGIDEVGRGPLAGPVAVCACAVPVGFNFRSLPKVTDSKKLTAKVREEICVRVSLGDLPIKHEICFVSEKVIDTKGLSFAIKSALTKALTDLKLKPAECRVLLDGGLRAPIHYKNQKTIIKGDAKEKVIGLASVLAKVERDGYMTKLAKKYPQYGFERHKGYGTRAHYTAIKKHGVSKVHRRRFLRGIAKL